MPYWGFTVSGIYILRVVRDELLYTYWCYACNIYSIMYMIRRAGWLGYVRFTFSAFNFWLG